MKNLKPMRPTPRYRLTMKIVNLDSEIISLVLQSYKGSTIFKITLVSPLTEAATIFRFNFPTAKVSPTRILFAMAYTNDG